MGIGKLAIAIIIIGTMVFGLVAAMSIAKHDKTTDAICTGNQTCNGTAQLAETVGTQGANLGMPVFILVAIMFLASVFFFMRRSSK